MIITKVFRKGSLSCTCILSLYVFLVFLGRCLVKKAIYREIPILKTWVEYKQTVAGTVAQCAFKRRNNIEMNESQYAIVVQTPNLFLFLTP